MNALELLEFAEQTGEEVSFSVLDLPIEKQKEIAKRDGFGDDLEVWRSHNKKIIEKADKFSNKVEIVHFDTIEEAEKAGHTVPHWHDEHIKPKVTRR